MKLEPYSTRTITLKPDWARQITFVVVLDACDECGATVDPMHWQTHRDWHTKCEEDAKPKLKKWLKR